MSKKTSVHNKKINSAIKEFKQFLDSEVESAIIELKNIKSDKNRQHIQKLVYANLIDRFDHLLDRILLLSFDNQPLKENFLKTKEDKTVNERRFFEALLESKEEILTGLESEFQAFIRSNIICRRHALKLTRFLESLSIDTKKFSSSRVNESTGKIFHHRKKHPSIPNSIIGYADWLYCRRSAIVHGGKSAKITDSDLIHLNSTYRVKCTGRVKIVLSSIKNTKVFYSDLIDNIEYPKLS